MIDQKYTTVIIMTVIHVCYVCYGTESHLGSTLHKLTQGAYHVLWEANVTC